MIQLAAVYFCACLNLFAQEKLKRTQKKFALVAFLIGNKVAKFPMPIKTAQKRGFLFGRYINSKPTTQTITRPFTSINFITSKHHVNSHKLVKQFQTANVGVENVCVNGFPVELMRDFVVENGLPLSNSAANSNKLIERSDERITQKD